MTRVGDKGWGVQVYIRHRVILKLIILALCSLADSVSDESGAQRSWKHRFVCLKDVVGLKNSHYKKGEAKTARVRDGRKGSHVFKCQYQQERFLSNTETSSQASLSINVPLALGF